jgi:hypothetical protein
LDLSSVGDPAADLEPGAATDFKVKQNIIHAAEIGLTYQF